MKTKLKAPAFTSLRNIRVFLILFSGIFFKNNTAWGQNDCKCVVYYCSGCVNNHLCPVSQPFSTYADALKSAESSCPYEKNHDIRCTGNCPTNPGTNTQSNNNNGLVNASTDAIGKGIAAGDATTTLIGISGLALNVLMNAGKKSAAEQEQLKRQQEEQQRIAAEQQRLNELERQRKAEEERIKFEKEKDSKLSMMKGTSNTSSLALKGVSTTKIPPELKTFKPKSKEELAYEAEQARRDKWMNDNWGVVNFLPISSSENGVGEREEPYKKTLEAGKAFMEFTEWLGPTGKLMSQVGKMTFNVQAVMSKNINEIAQKLADPYYVPSEEDEQKYSTQGVIFAGTANYTKGTVIAHIGEKIDETGWKMYTAAKGTKEIWTGFFSHE